MYAEKRQMNKRKIAYIVLAVFLLVLIASGSAYAYLKWNGGVNNTFTYESSVDPVIYESFDNSEKKDVSINVGATEYSVYVRAAIVATWMDSTGQVLAKDPVPDIDYTLDLNLSDGGWFRGDDGYYYYSSPVASGDSTDVLINLCKPITDAPESGYSLNVDVIAQTIQAAGTTDSGDVPMVTEAWNVAVASDGKLTK